MKYTIQKWGRIEKKLNPQNYELGGNMMQGAMTQGASQLYNTSGGNMMGSGMMQGIGSLGALTGDALQSTGSSFGTIGGGALKGAATGMALGPIGAAVGGAIGLVGGLFKNKKNKEEEEAQKVERNKMILAQKQQNLTNLGQSSGGVGNSMNYVSPMAYGGYLVNPILAKSGIHINPANKGKFNATKKATGKSTEELTHSKNPLTRKRAIFAQNAKKWSHAEGGPIGPTEPGDEQGLNTTTPGFTPSDKTQWYPNSASASRYKELVKSGKTKEAEDMIFGYYSNEPYGPYQEGTHKEYETKGRIRSIRAKDLIDLDTKTYKAPKDYNALLDIVKPKVISRKPGDIETKNLTIRFGKGGFLNPIANETKNLLTYQGGGTHQQNPLGGIPLGKSLNGKQNTVEQGETSFKFKEGKYVFSNRLKLK